MKISDARIGALSMDIARSLIAANLVKNAQLNPISMEIRKVFNFFLQNEEKIDQKTREKIATLKRGVLEGSQEWEILYRQYFNEELEKM